ncbi:hypothetical protein GINT2_000601 [Glugoides intestinalis]
MEDNKILLLELLHKVVYAERKLSKAQLKALDANKILDDPQYKDITLKQASIIILALAKVLNRRFKALIEDCNHVFQHITIDAIKKKYRTPSTRNITLDLGNDKICIDDAMLEIKDGDALFDSLLLESAFDHPLFELDGREATSIEVARDSMGSSVIQPGFDSSIAVGIKRRKVEVDSRIEIAENVFRSNIRNTVDILMKQTRLFREVQGIHLEKEFQKLFEERKEDQEMIEEQRENEIEFEVSANEITVEVEEPSIQQTISLANLPEKFEFNFITQNCSVLAKAMSFVELLVWASKGSVSVIQKESFSEIECAITI